METVVYTEHAKLLTRLSNLLMDMEVPLNRRDLSDTSIRWLNRNLGVRNHLHPNYKESMEIIAKVITWST